MLDNVLDCLPQLDAELGVRSYLHLRRVFALGLLLNGHHSLLERYVGVLQHVDVRNEVHLDGALGEFDRTDLVLLVVERPWLEGLD